MWADFHQYHAAGAEGLEERYLELEAALQIQVSCVQCRGALEEGKGKRRNAMCGLFGEMGLHSALGKELERRSGKTGRVKRRTSVTSISSVYALS